MPYEFAENEYELDPQASSAHGSVPPRKRTEIDILDPPFPPKRAPGPIPAVPSPLLFRVFVGLLLAGLAVITLFLVFVRR